MLIRVMEFLLEFSVRFLKILNNYLNDFSRGYWDIVFIDYSWKE